MAPHSSTLAWKTPWTEEPGRLQSIGSLRVGHNWATSFSLFTFMHWRRKWQPTRVFLPGEFQGRGRLVAAVYGVTQSRTWLKRLSSSSSWADDPQTAEQLYQRNSCTVKKVLGPTTGLPTWGSGKGTENPQGIRLWRPVGFDYRIFRGLEKQTLGGNKQSLVHTRSQKKGAETELDLPVSLQESLVEGTNNREGTQPSPST